MLSIFKPLRQSCRTSTGLLLVRVLVGGALMMHGYGKIQDPLGWMGAEPPYPGYLLAMAAYAEFGGGLFLILGLLTPIASLFVAGTMAGAIHYQAILQNDPFISTGGKSYELATVYLTAAILILLAGPGRHSLDNCLFGEQPSNAEKAPC